MNRETVVAHGRSLLKEMQEVYEKIGVPSQDPEADTKLDAELATLDKKSVLLKKMVAIERTIGELEVQKNEAPKDNPHREGIISPRRLVQTQTPLASTVAEQTDSSYESN